MQRHKPSVHISIMKFISILNDLSFYLLHWDQNHALLNCSIPSNAIQEKKNMDTLLSNQFLSHLQCTIENRANLYLARTIHVKPIQFPFLTRQMV